MTTREVFDEIAPGWYSFRHHSIFRTELEEMAGRWRRGRLVNVGCGHGADFIPFKDSFELHGVDFSRGMLENAVKYSRKFRFSVSLVAADADNLPFLSDTFDWAIAIATYHHIKDREDRLLAFRELYRVLRPGGEAFITVWNRRQPRFWLKSGDAMVPWQAGDRTIHRYYHLFTYGELKKTAQRAGFEVVKISPESSYKFPFRTFSRNICLLVRKQKPS
ncbi:MAG: SAM-dependent methyltransferase [Chloroflexi bacterium RBG_16_56_11]|nr:MAG: SAM-dependent methyltransferase [Chloroflexi bacterium RBG_16_56_11]